MYAQRTFSGILLSCLLLCSFHSTRACFILYLSDGDRILVGNHEDWFAQDAAIKINPPTQGRYGSVVFTFLSEGWAQGGMNEKGLFFDGAYTPYQEVTFDSQRTTFPGYIWREVLDKCSTVDEALQLLAKYKLPDLEESHIFLADATDQAVVVGVKDGKMEILERMGSYLLQTNFNPWHPELSDEPVCERYQAAEYHLSGSNLPTIDNMRKILQETHQDSLTVYSNIYDLRQLTISTYNKRDFANPIEVSLPEVFKYGSCILSLDSLAKDRSYLEQCSEKGPKEVVVSGHLLDKKNGSPIGFANIGIPEKNIGTLSDPDGSFELVVPAEFVEDSVVFSFIGYEVVKMKASVLNGSTIEFEEKAILLDEVVIERKNKHKVARMGWMGGKDGILPFDTIQGGGAVAVLLEAPDRNVFIDKVMFRLLYNSKDTLSFRLHFFEYDSLTDGPGQEILQKEIILTDTRKYGWVRKNIAKENIVIPYQKFFVGLEWLEDRATREQLMDGLKDYHYWKKSEYENGNEKIEFVPASQGYGASEKGYYRHNGNMMNWPGFHDLPPWTGLMIETGKHKKTEMYRTFERKTSFGTWKEVNSTLNAVVVVSY